MKVTRKRYKRPFELITERVKPYRDTLTKQVHESRYWLYWDKREFFFSRIEDRPRVLVCVIVSTHINFRFISTNWVISHRLKVFDVQDDGIFSVLQSSIHQAWARKYSSTLGQAINYSTSDAFDTFVLPEISINLVSLGGNYHTTREKCLAERSIGLTQFYNLFHDNNLKENWIESFRQLHVELDYTVAAAYGWQDIDLDHSFHETKQGVRLPSQKPLAAKSLTACWPGTTSATPQKRPRRQLNPLQLPPSVAVRRKTPAASWRWICKVGQMTALNADRPSDDPNNDLFGHAPFAKSLADSICRYTGVDGLVLGLYGPWGSGKLTVLNYVQYYLAKRPEAEQPVVVTFNPWWFSGQENLARAFLGQLQAVLPSKSEKLKKLGDLLSDFAEGVGGLIDLTGVTGGAGRWLGGLWGKAKRKPKDVPALKAEISKVLKEANQRILVIIDDIDRLNPEEVRQLFTVIKALANFPNVIYLLAFDREVAVEAIKQQTGLPGERYLEKIIQVPFEIPQVDRESLRAAFFKRLDEVLTGTPEGMFDHGYWTNIFYDGIDPLIEVPRDIVRLVNTLSVTYRSVLGEVNPVDFIAIEALRVFRPKVYDTVRSNPKQFAGHRSTAETENETKARKAFHDSWRGELSEEMRACTFALLQRMFPKLEDSIYGSDWIAGWRRDRRVCVPELFPTYFRLSVPPGEISRSEMMAFLASADNADQLEHALLYAASVIRPNGISKVRTLLERVMDYVEKDIPEHHIATLINVLLDVGDELVLPSDRHGGFDFGNESRIRRVVYHLLKRVQQPQRVGILRKAFADGRGIGVQSYLLIALVEEIAKHASGGEEALLDAAGAEALKAIWIEKVRAAGDTLLSNAQLHRILTAWRTWGDPEEVRKACINMTEADDGLLAFVPHFCSHSRSHIMGEWAVKIQPRLNPTLMQDYIDTEVAAKRLGVLSQAGKVPEQAQESVGQFLKEFEMIKSGKNPDGIGAFDD